MSSVADHESDVQGHGVGRATTGQVMTVLAPEERIVAHENEYGFSLEYRDPNPETRYLPREQTTWEALKEMWRLGGKHPSAFRIR